MQQDSKIKIKEIRVDGGMVNNTNFTQSLANITQIKIIKPDNIDILNSVFHIFPIRLQKRDKLKSFLEGHGIGTEIHYPVPPHKQIALRSLFQGDSFPLSEEIHKNILSLPISYIHSKEDIDFVCDKVNQFDL